MVLTMATTTKKEAMKVNIQKVLGNKFLETKDLKENKYKFGIFITSWNDRPAKIDIRQWNEDFTQTMKGKGMTLTDEQFKFIGEAYAALKEGKAKFEDFKYPKSAARPEAKAKVEQPSAWA